MRLHGTSGNKYNKVFPEGNMGPGEEGFRKRSLPLIA